MHCFGWRPPIGGDFDRLKAAQLGATVAQASQTIANPDQDRSDGPQGPSE
jgi:hypothetical protein